MGIGTVTRRLPAEATTEVVGAGILLTLTTLAVNVRMDEKWGTGIFLVLDALACAYVLGVGLKAAAAETPPAPGATGLLVAGEILLALTIGRLADVLGAEGGSGSLTWTSLLFAGVVAYAAWVLGSPISALFSALALGLALVAAVDWIFDIQSVNTFRWLFAILIVAYAAASTTVGAERERHGVQLVNAAGAVTLVLLFSMFGSAVSSAIGSAFAGGSPSFGGPFGWELVSLVAASGLVAYAVARNERGPGYIGGVALLLYVFIAASPGTSVTLVGWPLALLILAAGALVLAMRPRASSPPSAGPPPGAP